MGERRRYLVVLAGGLGAELLHEVDGHVHVPEGEWRGREVREKEVRERSEREVGEGSCVACTYGADISSSLMRITTSPVANGAVISSADRYCEEICPEMTVSPPGI